MNIKFEKSDVCILYVTDIQFEKIYHYHKRRKSKIIEIGKPLLIEFF